MFSAQVERPRHAAATVLLMSALQAGFATRAVLQDPVGVPNDANATDVMTPARTSVLVSGIAETWKYNLYRCATEISCKPALTK